MTTQVNTRRRRRSPALVAGIVILFLGIVLLITLAMFASFDEVTNVFEAGKVDIVLTETEWNPEDGDLTVPNEFIDKNPAITNKEDTVSTYVFLKVTIPYDDDPNLKIEAAQQDNPATSGKVVYTNNNSSANQKVPIYKFVATGKRTSYPEGQTWNEPVSFSGYYDNTCNSFTQKVNPGWYLLKLGNNGSSYDPIIDESKKTLTYIYAYVRTDASNNMLFDSESSPILEPLVARGTVDYPLFNKVYLQNFRERDLVEDNEGHVTQTSFPNPGQDYSIHIEAYGIQANFLKPNNTTTTNPEEVWKDYITKNS